MAAQTTGFDPVHIPPWHVSVCEHALPSVHAVPSVFGGFVHAPFSGLHVPALWHWSLGLHTTGFVPTQVPPWQMSVCVQALPSMHAAPLVFGGFEHTPLPESQTPATWH
jgi:hypothetical protein